MSILQKFSVAYTDDKKKKMKTQIQTSKKRADILKSEAAQALIKLGYSLEILMNLLKVNSFESIDQALDLLEKDPETHKYHHKFYLKENNEISSKGLCCICNCPEEEHMINEGEELKETTSNMFPVKENNVSVKRPSVNSNRNNENIEKYYSTYSYCEMFGNHKNKKWKSEVKENLPNFDYDKYNNLNKCLNNKDSMQRYKDKNNEDIKNQNLITSNNYDTSQINLITDSNNIGIINQSLNNKSEKTDCNENTEKRLKKELTNHSQSQRNPNKNNEQNPFNKPKINQFKYGKMEITKETLELFQDPDICRICFSEKVNKNSISQKSCNHFFCDECLKKYLESNIMNGKVLGIRCLMGGCPKIYNDEDIKANTTEKLYLKYKKFKNEQIKLNNPDSLFVHCPYPDCEEIVNCDEVEDEFVECQNKHVFCYKCHQLGKHKNGECKNDDDELLQQIQKANKNGLNFKQCPKCKVIIEKNEGCNQMHCINCGYNFCWLCLKKYTDDHYALYNVTGCPGMRFESDSGSKWTKNTCLKILWYLFSCFLGFLAIILVFLFYLFFGCPYEFIKCYTKKKGEDDEDDDYEIGNDYNYSDQPANNYGNNNEDGNNQNVEGNINTNNNQNNSVEDPNKKPTWKICLIGFLGFLCQPLYLMFYILYGLMECYRRFNCWFYYVDH